MAKSEPGGRPFILTLTLIKRLGHVIKNRSQPDKRLLVSAQGYQTMLKIYFAFGLLSVLLSTAASARHDCMKEAEEQQQFAEQQLQSARVGSSDATKEYSTCVKDQGREYCDDEFSKLQSARDAVKTADSEYKKARSQVESGGCEEQPEPDQERE